MKLLIILNDLVLENKNKEKILLQVKEEDITFLGFLEKDDTINEYGKKGKHGALIIKTK